MIKACAVATILALASVAAAKPASPDDRYAKQLAGVTLVDGVGFPDVLELGTPTPQMYKTFGPATEKLGYMFWYFYDRGSWNLTVVAETTASGDFVTRAIEISGAHAPATKAGVHVGDPASAVTKAYGAGVAFTSTLSSPKFRHENPDPDAAYKGAVYYPKLSMLFVIKHDVVERIVVLRTTPPKKSGS